MWNLIVWKLIFWINAAGLGNALYNSLTLEWELLRFVIFVGHIFSAGVVYHMYRMSKKSEGLY